jgi:hypothetical protein
MANILGGLNYDATLSAEDYKAYRNLIENELLTRFLLSAGYPPNTLPTTGIVDLIDPAAISSSETTRPFLVTISALDPLQIKVNPGMAITPAGAIIKSDLIFSNPLARTLANDINVIYLESSLVLGGTNLLNDYQESLYSQEIQNPTSLGVVLLSDWNNTSIFPPDRKKNCVVIAVVSVVPTSAGDLELQIDHTRNIYSFNRPWFSIQDIQHRSQVGGGEVTTNNPHGTSLNDLSTAGNVSLFQGLLDTGVVVSRDTAISKLTGAKYCVEQIPVTRIKTDLTGSITARSIYGGAGSKYCELLTFPTRMGSIYQSGVKANPIVAEWIEGTNILVFGSAEPLTHPLVAEYTEAKALVPPVSANNSTVLSFGTPLSNEILVSGGLTHTTIADPTTDLVGSGPFPRRYAVYHQANGTLVTYPQVLVPAIFLNDLNSFLDTTVIYPGRIRIGITKASTVSTMSLGFVLNGKDLYGNALSETVTISTANGYVDETLPSTNYDSDNQQYMTQNVFSALENIQVTRTDDGPLTTIQIWVDCEPTTSSDLNDAIKVATVFWDGHGISGVEDARMVSKGFYRPGQGQLIKATAEALLDSGRLLSQLTTPPTLNQDSSLIFSEDFEDLKNFDSSRGFESQIASVGTIGLLNNSAIIAGTTITLRPGKTLTFTTLAPAVAGEVQIGANLTATLNNIVAAVNDPAFACNIVASVGSANTVKLVIQDLVGSLGNAVDLTTSASSSALYVGGFNSGFDAYGECYLERAVVGLKSIKVPANTNLNPYNYGYRNRYRSRAFACVGLQQKFAIALHKQNKAYPTSIRIRGATITEPNQWLPWQIATPAAPGYLGLYVATLSSFVFKVQVEIYGEARGCSVYQLKSNV